MQYFLKEFLELGTSRIKSNLKIYKEIDFNYDIDKKISGYYLIERESNELTFMYDNFKSMLNYGGYSIEDNYTVSKPSYLTFRNFALCRSTFYESKFISNYEIAPNDIFHLEFDNSTFKNFRDKDAFSFNFVNYEGLKDIKNEVPNSKKKAEGLAFCFYKEMLILNSYHKEKSNSLLRLNFSTNSSNNFKFIVDLKNGNFYWNDKKYRFSHDLYFNNSLTTIALIYYQFKLYVNEFTVQSKNLIIGKRQGFIYFKPLIFEKKGWFKIVLIYKGKVLLEVYNDDKWVNVNSDYRFYAEENKEIKFRLKLNHGDKVFNIILTYA